MHSYPCVYYWIKKEEPPHLIRVFFVSILIDAGYSDIDIINKIKRFKWVDFNYKITEHQIKYIRNGKYRIPTCHKIKELGFCIDNCNRWKQHRMKNKIKNWK